MSSFEERYYLGESTRLQRIKRDLNLCLESLRFLAMWFMEGRRIRRAYRDAQANGRPLVLEDLFREPPQ